MKILGMIAVVVALGILFVSGSPRGWKTARQWIVHLLLDALALAIMFLGIWLINGMQ